MLEDAALASAYDDAINVVAQTQGVADQAYSNAMAQFNVMENLRRTLDFSVDNAQTRIFDVQVL